VPKLFPGGSNGKNGGLFVLDANPNPDINIDSGFMRQACYRGYAYGDIMTMILRLSFQKR
jgi:D-alanine-D-alanine ligase